jgi:hypothetical protein
MLGVQYKTDEWKLFNDSSKVSLKNVLQRNGNHLASFPVAHAVHLKEKYENLLQLLEKINYKQHQGMVCGDMKVLCMLLGQQQGCTKFPCYICEWDSRAQVRHWIQRQWTHRTRLILGFKNILKKSIVDPEKIILSPLHIKVCLMKQFVKALDGNADCFHYLSNKFPALSKAQVKEGIFVGPQDQGTN